MSIDPMMLESLVCPEDKGALLYFAAEQSLYNPRLQRRYAVVDDIPVMLVDEAMPVDAAEHQRLMKKAETEGIRPNWT